MSSKLLSNIEVRTSCVEFDSLATPETPKDGFKSPILEEQELTPHGASFGELLIISMPRMAIRMAWAAQWAALGPYLQTMLPRYAVQLTQLSGPLSGVLMGPIVEHVEVWSSSTISGFATPETPKDGFKSPILEEQELTPHGASFGELLIISMPRMAIRMAWAAQWAALGPYLQTMLPRYAVQLTQLSGPLCGVLVGPIVGVYSDQNTSRFGRRRPYLVVSAVGSIICWILMGYTRELGDALGDVGSGKPGEFTDRTWTALLTVLFYLLTGFMMHLARTPSMLLISDFAGKHQTVGAALGQGWAVLGAVIVAVYTECFGAAYKSLA
ncbi:Glycoside-Pentoside-Hexuronide (GPH):Cation Symporter Family, partial [Phytophthora palmivora]